MPDNHEQSLVARMIMADLNMTERRLMGSIISTNEFLDIRDRVMRLIDVAFMTIDPKETTAR